MSKLPEVSASVSWINIHAGKAHEHDGIVEEYFERGKKVMASVRTPSGRRMIVPAGRLQLSSRMHNVKEIKTGNSN